MNTLVKPYLTLWVVLLCSSFGYAQTASAQEHNDIILATVNTHNIFPGDLKTCGRQGTISLTGDYEKSKATEEDIRWKNLQRLINHLLLLEEAREASLPTADITKEVNRNYYNYKNSFSTHEDLEKFLSDHQCTILEFQNWLNEDMTVSYYLHKRVYPQIIVSTEELREEFNKSQNLFDQKPVPVLKHIFISGSSEKSNPELLQKIYQAAVDPKNNFDSLISKHSESSQSFLGDRGAFLPVLEQLSSALTEAISTMKAGEISKPIRTNSGYYIVKVESIQPGEKADFEKHAKFFIQKKLWTEKKDKLLQEKIKELRKKASLKIFMKEPQLLETQ